jgi:hypothetical protein
MLPPLSGDLSGIQLAMILSVVLLLAGFTALGHQLLFLAVALWLAFALVALLRQF